MRINTKPVISGLLLGFLALLDCVGAQAANSYGKTEQASLLLENGKFKEARALLATVDRKDADYP
jgi:hypothetical protein